MAICTIQVMLVMFARYVMPGMSVMSARYFIYVILVMSVMPVISARSVI